jgi:integrase/recombinase XerC
MKSKGRTKNYAAGEQTCPVCQEPLAEHETWPGARYWICDSLKCRNVIKNLKTGRYVGHNEHKCEGPGCDNFVPEALYDRHADFLTCCGECWIRRRTKGNNLLTCGCCGQEFRGSVERKPKDGLYFLNSRHYGDYIHEKYLTENCGGFRSVADEYLEGFATLHYRVLGNPSKALAIFFLFLTKEGVTSLEAVTPRTVTQYLSWGQKTGRNVVWAIPFLSTFFKWAIFEGHRKAANPIIPMLHNSHGTWGMPRPLEDTEVDFMWQLLDERGNSRLRLAAAIALESGLRVGEIGRLRLPDVDLKKQSFFVMLPNKGNRERTAFFSDLTVRFYHEWLAERDPECTHNNLLHNTRGNPCTTPTLIQEFHRVLCKIHKGKKVHETGFDSWSTHKLRHTMASNLVSAGADAATIMAAGGWKSYQAMLGYSRVDVDVARRGYDEATKRAKDKKATPSKKTLSLSEFLDRKKKAA